MTPSGITRSAGEKTIDGKRMGNAQHTTSVVTGLCAPGNFISLK